MLEATGGVNVANVKGVEYGQAHVLTPTERNTMIESYFVHQYGIIKLGLEIGGQPATQKEMDQLDVDYPMNKHIMIMCKRGKAFMEPAEEDVPTDDDRLLKVSVVEIGGDDDGNDSDVGYLDPDVEEEDME